MRAITLCGSEKESRAHDIEGGGTRLLTVSFLAVGEKERASVKAWGREGGPKEMKNIERW